MKSKFGNKVKWNGPVDVRHKGKFVFSKAVYDWYYCREIFLNTWYANNKRRRIAMSVAGKCSDKVLLKKRIENLAIFIYKIEDKLGIQDSRKTLFNETTFEKVVRLKIANFWLRDRARLSLFTLLLRAGIGSMGKEFNPSKDSLEDCIFAQRQIRGTKKAIKKFFDGYTKFEGVINGNNGWSSVMRTKNALELMVKPKPKVSEESEKPKKKAKVEKAKVEKSKVDIGYGYDAFDDRW